MISFVYFDLGGVVIRGFSGTNKWSAMKRNLRVLSDQEKDFDLFYDQNVLKIHIGLDVDSLIPQMKEKFHLTLPPNYSMLQDFVDQFNANKLIWPVIDKVSRICKVGLLTNMYPRMFSGICKRGLMPKTDWSVVIDSSVVKMQKPDKDIYELAEQKVGFSGNQILFIDNTKENLETAKTFGWKTFWYDSSDYESSTQELNKVLDFVL